VAPFQGLTSAVEAPQVVRVSAHQLGAVWHQDSVSAPVPVGKGLALKTS